MSGDSRLPPERVVQPICPYSPYALEVSVGGSFEGRYRLRSDKPTWIGRRPHESYARLVRCAHESAGKKLGTGGKKIGNAHLR
jgi:hypothetical protein